MRIKHLIEQQKDPKKVFVKMMRDFLPIAMDVIGLKTLPDFKLEVRVSDTEQPTFGKFVNEENRIYIGIEDRHPLDVLRTLAHELVHYKQGTEHELATGSGRTGSPEENEAHMLAGIVMRYFDKAHPEYFDVETIDVKENMDHSKDDRAVPELKAALLAQKDRIQAADEDGVYDIIDKVMTRIAKSHSISGQRLHDMWVDQYKEIPDTWIMHEGRSVIENREQFNYELAQKGFHFEQEISGVIYKVYNKKGGSDNIKIDALDQKNRVIGHASFSSHQYKDGLESLSTSVEPAWRGKGIATNMYAVMRMLGVNIHPASTQSDDGKKMWSKWNKQGDAQHLKSMNAKMAENFADGRHPEDKGDAKRHGINTKASVSSLRKTAKQGGRKGQLAHWLANMKAGRAKKNK
jgi:hypothetical protein